MKKTIIVLMVLVVANIASADIITSTDTFGTGANQFTIDFVNISGDTNPTSGYGIVNNDYRMGTYEITNDQWNKFKASYGLVTGSPSSAYNENAYWTASDLPTSNLSRYEATQFVNYLNTSKGYQAAYKFTGTQGTSNYTPAVWEPGDVGYNHNNPYRNSNAIYFLPTSDEWVKAAFWNGTYLQTYASKDNTSPIAGVEANYNELDGQPWNVSSGAEELNGTFNMMGNVWEWLETPYDVEGTIFSLRGGSFNDMDDIFFKPSAWAGEYPDYELYNSGIRVTSIIPVPEPATLALLTLGGLILRRRRA